MPLLCSLTTCLRRSWSCSKVCFLAFSFSIFLGLKKSRKFILYWAGSIVGAGPTWTTASRWPQEQRVVEGIEPTTEVVRSLQRVIFAIFSVATGTRNDCFRGLNLNFKNPGIVGLSACKSDHFFNTTLTRAARTPGKQWLKNPSRPAHRFARPAA